MLPYQNHLTTIAHFSSPPKKTKKKKSLPLIYIYIKTDDRPRPNNRHHPLNIMLHHKRPTHPPRPPRHTPHHPPLPAKIIQHVRMVYPHTHHLRPCILLPIIPHHLTGSSIFPFSIYQTPHPSAPYWRISWQFRTHGSGISRC